MTYHYPSWDELPAIDLYLDQVLLYVNQVTQNNIPSDKGLTASMVNNYVKHEQLTKPIKKKSWHLLKKFDAPLVKSSGDQKIISK